MYTFPLLWSCFQPLQLYRKPKPLQKDFLSQGRPASFLDVTIQAGNGAQIFVVDKCLPSELSPHVSGSSSHSTVRERSQQSRDFTIQQLHEVLTTVIAILASKLGRLPYLKESIG